jgi:hypothetical protein
MLFADCGLIKSACRSFANINILFNTEKGFVLIKISVFCYFIIHSIGRNVCALKRARSFHKNYMEYAMRAAETSNVFTSKNHQRSVFSGTALYHSRTNNLENPFNHSTIPAPQAALALLQLEFHHTKRSSED